MKPFPALTTRELPEAPRWTKAIGVGVVALGLAIGTGELILWPTLVVKFGPNILWGAFIGLTLQLFINYEVARHTLATGESFFTSSARLFKWFAPFWLVAAFFLYIWPGWASALGTILNALMGFGNPVLWAWATLILVLLMTLVGRQAYHTLEVSMKIIVPAFFILLLFVSFNNLSLNDVAQGVKGLFSIGWIPAGIDVSLFFSAIVFAGTGGMLNLCVSLWYRDKQVGMAAYSSPIKNPLTSQEQTQDVSGHTFEAKGQNLAHWKKWLSYVRGEQVIIFWLLGLITLFLLSINAYAVLAPRGIVPEGADVAIAQAAIFGETWGDVGVKAFLIMAFLMLFSVMWTIINAFTRIISDVIFVNSHVGPLQRMFSKFKNISQSKLYYLLVVLLVIIQAALVPFSQPLPYLVLTSVLGGMVMAIYVPVILVLNNRHLAQSLRPKLFSNFILVIAALTYTVFSIIVLLSLFGVM
ncbi:MAG TPA: Nramp family divalent metal transporter [Candidatus Saccharimonadales bacterium]|nr:Nramp family divalent metal transporter [Candidatus Saccharimonadales bacterium]